MQRARHVQFIVLAMLVLGSAACGGNDTSSATAFPDSLVDDELIVTVNAEPVTGRDLRVFTLVYQPEMGDSLNSRLFNLEVLNGFVDRVLLLQEAKAVGVTVDDSTHKWFVDQFEQSMGGPVGIRAFLGDSGVSREELERTIKLDLTVRSFIENRLGGDLNITEADARAYYDNNAERFSTPERVRARHILIRAEEGESEESRSEKRNRLGEVLKRARAGEDFAALAREHSEGPSAPNGGDLGSFSRRDMVKPFSDAAFALNPGGISDIVETQFGFHIIKVEERMEPSTQDYESIKDQLLEGLRQQALGAELENNLKRNRSVAIIEPKFDYGGLTQRESATFTR